MGEMIFMKRKTLACLMCAILVLGMLFMTGCNSKEKEAITSDLSSQLDSFKTSGSEQLAGVLEENDASLQALGIDYDEFAQQILDGFSYSIGAITVDGGAESATVDITFTTKTPLTMLTALVYNIPSAATSLTEDVISSEEKLNAFIGEQLVAAVKNAETDETTVTVTCSKTDDKWALDDIETQLYKALGLDAINLDGIYEFLGVKDFNELSSLINGYLK